jgi:hypothetical protein
LPDVKSLRAVQSRDIAVIVMTGALALHLAFVYFAAIRQQCCYWSGAARFLMWNLQQGIIYLWRFLRDAPKKKKTGGLWLIKT